MIKPSLQGVIFDLSSIGYKMWEKPKDILIAFGKVEYSEMD